MPPRIVGWARSRRHLGENGKLGVGYSFAGFSDKLTDLSYDHQGWFLNLVGKF